MLRALTGGRQLRLGLLLWLLAPLLVWWALRVVPLTALRDALAALHLLEIAGLLLLSTAVILSFAGRWWVILRGQGERVPWLALVRYRLAAFGVSYFTPGPQVGGEPLQVYLLRERHGVPLAAATASVALDRLLDLLVNAALLALAAGFVTARGVLGGRLGAVALLLALALAALPAGYLLALAAGQRPLAALRARLQPAPGRLARLMGLLAATEAQAGDLGPERRAALAWAALVSGLSWALMLAELWLILSALGLSPSAVELAGVLVALRLAFLLPSPGGLGALEAGQVLAFQALGLNPAAGLSLSLIIRARDVLFGGLGLWWGGTAIGLRERIR